MRKKNWSISGFGDRQFLLLRIHKETTVLLRILSTSFKIPFFHDLLIVWNRIRMDGSSLHFIRIIAYASTKKIPKLRYTRPSVVFRLCVCVCERALSDNIWLISLWQRETNSWTEHDKIIHTHTPSEMRTPLELLFWHYGLLLRWPVDSADVVVVVVFLFIFVYFVSL